MNDVMSTNAITVSGIPIALKSHPVAKAAESRTQHPARNEVRGSRSVVIRTARADAVVRQRVGVAQRLANKGLTCSNKYADPYMLSESTREGRDMLLRDEFKPAPPGSPELLVEQQLTSLLQFLGSRDLKPAEIPGHLFRNLNGQQLRQVFMIINILGAHPAAALSRELYGDPDYAESTRKNSEMRPGAFGEAPISENLFDTRIGCHDTDRSNSIHGPLIGDRRHIILLKNTGSKLQVASITAFGGADGNGSGKPPRGQEHEYDFLLEENDTTTQIPAGITVVIRYSHVVFTKPTSSYVRLSMYFELPSSASIAWSGHASIKSHKTLADAFRFDEDHDLRAEGERQAHELAMKAREMGNDNEKLQERKERQERELREGRERKERDEAEAVERARKTHERDDMPARTTEQERKETEEARQVEKGRHEEAKAHQEPLDDTSRWRPTPPRSSPEEQE
ncbi:hypothetical protein LTR85_001219 [Meristemomyces frigidus]|nr:hypothetical protein LTR85_001219 [Meristemomyces frigidus]